MEEEGLSAASTGFSAAACAGEDFGSADPCDACGARRTAVGGGSEGFGSGVFSWEGGSPAGAFSGPPGVLSPGTIGGWPVALSAALLSLWYPT